MTKYRKFAVAVAGVVVLLVGQYFGWDSVQYTTVVSVLTALGVYGVPNTV